MDPWDIQDLRSIPAGEMPRSKYPPLSDLFQEGNVQVSPAGAGYDPIEALAAYTATKPQDFLSPEFYRSQRAGTLEDVAAARAFRGDFPGAEAAQKLAAPIRLEEEKGRERTAEMQRLRATGEEQRRGIVLQEEMQAQTRLAQSAQEHTQALERIRKTPLSGILGMTLEQFEALPPDQQEQYRRAVLTQSGGFGQVLQSLMTMAQMEPDAEKRENYMNLAWAHASALFTKRSYQDFITTTMDKNGKLKVRFKALDPSQAAPGIRPEGQVYGPQEPWADQAYRQLATSGTAPTPTAGRETGFEEFMAPAQRSFTRR